MQSSYQSESPEIQLDSLSFILHTSNNMYHASLNILAQPRLSKTVQDVFYTFHPHIDTIRTTNIFSFLENLAQVPIIYLPMPWRTGHCAGKSRSLDDWRLPTTKEVTQPNWPHTISLSWIRKAPGFYDSFSPNNINELSFHNTTTFLGLKSCLKYAIIKTTCIIGVQHRNFCPIRYL